MSPAQAEAALDAITAGDPDGDHGEADRILLAVVPVEVSDAYERLVARSKWWATA